MIHSEGDLVFKPGEENLELYRIFNVKRDEASESVWYDLQYCCEFTDRSDPKSIIRQNRGVKTNIPSSRVMNPTTEFIDSYMRLAGVNERDLKYSIRGKLV